MAITLLRSPRTSGAEIESVDPSGLTFGAVESIVFDGTLSESYEASVDWTDHPVEDGSTISDHGIDAPRTVTLEGVITQTPWLINAPLPDPERLNAALETLQKLTRDRLPVFVVTGLTILENYVIASMTVSRSGDGGQKIDVSMSLKELRTVEAQFVAIPPRALAASIRPAASAPVSGGTQSPPVVTSIAASGVDIAGALF